MVIKKKLSEEAIQRFVSKGAKVKEDKKRSKVICLRMPISMVEDVDEKVKGKRAYNRTTWILSIIDKELRYGI